MREPIERRTSPLIDGLAGRAAATSALARAIGVSLASALVLASWGCIGGKDGGMVVGDTEENQRSNNGERVRFTKANLHREVDRVCNRELTRINNQEKRGFIGARRARGLRDFVGRQCDRAKRQNARFTGEDRDYGFLTFRPARARVDVKCTPSDPFFEKTQTGTVGGALLFRKIPRLLRVFQGCTPRGGARLAGTVNGGCGGAPQLIVDEVINPGVRQDDRGTFGGTTLVNGRLTLNIEGGETRTLKFPSLMINDTVPNADESSVDLELGESVDKVRIDLDLSGEKIEVDEFFAGFDFEANCTYTFQ